MPAFKNNQQINSKPKTESNRLSSSSNGSRIDEKEFKPQTTKVMPMSSTLNPQIPIMIDLSSDDNETVPPKKSKSHKHKHNKRTKDMDVIGSVMNTEFKANEVDHNQIIHDLKVNSQLFGRHFDLQL